MKLAVFNEHRIGIVERDHVRDVTAALPEQLSGYPEMRMDWLIRHWSELGPMLAATREGELLPLAGVRLLPPSPRPSHVFAAPANYRKHIGELGASTVTKPGRTAREQGFFLKAPGSLCGAGAAIELPRGSQRRFDHEAELAVVIGRGGRNIPRERALEHVFGYSCLVDLTMRTNPPHAEEERSMRKSFATFTPLGPYLVTADEVPDPQRLQSRLWINDSLRQDASTADMIVGVAELIELVSSVLPLSPGDVIASGTPEGVGPVEPGDRLRIEIEGIGSMTLPVRECEATAPRPF